MFIMTLFHSLHVKFSCISVHIITYYIYDFYRENGVGGGGGNGLFTVHPLPPTWTVR